MPSNKMRVSHSSAELDEIKNDLRAKIDLNRLMVSGPTLRLRDDLVSVLNGAFKREEGIIDLEEARARKKAKKVRWHEQYDKSSQAQG